MFPFPKTRAVVMLAGLSLALAGPAPAQTCNNSYPVVRVTFKSEQLPAAMVGLFPYLPVGPGANDNSPAAKYTVETWAGTGNFVHPACGCLWDGINLVWSGNRNFLTGTDTRIVNYLGSPGCGGGNEQPATGQFAPGPTSTTSLVLTASFPNTTAQYSSCFPGDYYYLTNFTSTLSAPDTPAAALARAESHITNAANSLQFWNNNSPATAGQAANLMSPTAPITCNAERVKFRIELCAPCSAAAGDDRPITAGSYVIVYFYKVWNIGDAEPAEVTNVITEERDFSTAPYVVDYQPYPFALEQGKQCKLVTVKAMALDVFCGLSSPGDGTGANNSVDMSFGLGRRPNGKTAGALAISATTISANLYAPAALQLLAVANPDVTVVRLAGVLRQVKAPEVLADIVTLSATSYQVSFYLPSQAGAPDGNGVYAITGSPYAVYLVENPDAPGTNNRIRFTETRGSSSKVTLFAYDSATNTMTMTSGNGLRVDILQKTPSGANTIETRTIKDNAGQTVSVVQETKNPDNKVIQRILDPSGVALTTNVTYYTDQATDGGAFGHIKQTVEPSGRWTTYAYDSSGRVTDQVIQFLNTATASAANLNREIATSYTTVADLDGDGLPENLTTTIESLLGTETGRSFELVYSKPVTFSGQTAQVRAAIRATVAGAAWNDAANLVTLRRSVVAGGTLAYKPLSELLPDQTLTLYQYDQTSTTLTTTVWQGQPNATKDAVVAGTRTVTVEDLLGHLQSLTTSDIASTLVLSASVVTTADAFGRPTRIDYSDGTFETFSYACCGLDTSVDRTGLATTYVYDALGRVTNTSHAGLTTLNTYDPDGRLLTASRQGSDSSIITQQTNTYDLAGRQLTTKDALNRTTGFTEVINGSGYTVRTTTLPDTGTKILTYAKDGALLSVTGTAAAQLSYVYSVDASGPSTQEIRLGPSGQTTEWIKTYTDFAGRPYKTVYADATTAQSYYNSLGQLIRQVDPDGIPTLFAYNALGEREVAATDLNANGTIDYAGTDRVTKSVSVVASKTDGGTYTVQRTTTQVWETDSQDVATTAAISEQSNDGLHSWQTLRGLTTSAVTTLDGSGGRTVTTTTPDGVKTIQVYAAGRLVSTTVKTAANLQLGAATFAYDPHGRLQTSTDARNGTTSYVYFADDQVNTVTTPDPDTTQSGGGYDPQTTTYAYDTAGRVSTVTQPDATVVNTTYWPTGAVKRTWGSRTYPSEYAYDTQLRVKTLTTWQDFAGSTGVAVTTWNYNPVRGWLDNKRYNDNTGPNYTYKASGRLLTRTWARGIVTTYGYNPAGDLSGVTYSDTTPSVSFAFDRSGRPKTTTDAAGVCNWTYDSSGQLQNEVYSSGLMTGLTVNRSFDSLSRLSGLTASSVPSVAYSYDDASRLKTVTQGTNTATYSYVSNSPLVGGVVFQQAGATRLTTTKVYDNLNRLASITNTPSASTALSYAYTYNAANQRTRATRGDGSHWDYTYDALGQVTSGKKTLASSSILLGTDSAWTYDDIGNRKTATTSSQASTYTSNLLNQYSQRTVPGTVDVLGTAATDATVTVNGAATTRQGGAWYASVASPNATGPAWTQVDVSGVRYGGGPGGADAVANGTRHVFVPKTPEPYTYDQDGNLTSDGRWTYTWDAENRLIACETQTGILPPAGPFPLSQRRHLDFTYDAQGRRILKKVSNWNGSIWVLASSTTFLYDGWNLIGEFNSLSTLTLTRSYVWGLDLSGSYRGAGGVGGLLQANDTSTTHMVAYDGNGNVAAYVNASTGVTSAIYEYNIFGETLVTDGPSKDTFLFRFSSKYSDSETGMLYYGLRYYNAAAGRWLNKDPLGEAGGANLYRANGNDCINYIDPEGLNPLKGLFNFVREVPALLFDVLDGDLFRADVIGGKFTNSQCQFLFTVTGINTDRRGNIANRDRVAKYPEFSGIPSPQAVYNPTFAGLLGNVGFQALGDELGTISVTSRKMAGALKAAYRQALANKCPDMCIKIYIEAHSQGGAIAIHALALVSDDIRKHVFLSIVGGQWDSTGQGLGGERNIHNKYDIVPKVPNQPSKLITSIAVETFDPASLGIPKGQEDGPFSAHTLLNDATGSDGSYYIYREKHPWGR